MTEAPPASARTGAAEPFVPRSVLPSSPMLGVESIVLHGTAGTRDAAIREAGRLLVASGAVDEAYPDAMLQRERQASSLLRPGIAIPHGTREAKQLVRRPALALVRYDAPVDWAGQPVRVVIGIAGNDRQHLALLGRIARLVADPGVVPALVNATSASEVLTLLAAVNGAHGTRSTP